MPDKQSLTDIFSMQTDFSQGGILRFLVAILIALVFSLAMSATYKVYYKDNEPVDGSIARSFPLMGPAVTTIFWMIQFSLPLSLGLLGALSFVRFRTPIKRAEDIAFILLLIAGSLACAIGHFVSLIFLLLLIFAYGLVRDLIPGIQSSNKKFAIVTIHSLKEIEIDELNKKLLEVVDKSYPVSLNVQDGISTYVFNLNKFDKADLDKISGKIKDFDKKAKIHIFFPENQYGAY